MSSNLTKPGCRNVFTPYIHPVFLLFSGLAAASTGSADSCLDLTTHDVCIVALIIFIMACIPVMAEEPIGIRETEPVIPPVLT